MNKEYIKQVFAEHRVTVIQDTDRYFAADYRQANGSSDYYISFIVDKLRGNLIISGDLGDCVATWYNPLTPQKLNSFIRNDVYYFLKKVQCSTDMWNYDSDDAYAAIKDMLTDGEEFEVPDSFDYLSEKEFFRKLRDEVDKSYDYNQFCPTESLWDMVTAVDPDCTENLHYCGRTAAKRVYLWLYAFDDVCKQIFENGEKDMSINEKTAAVTAALEKLGYHRICELQIVCPTQNRANVYLNGEYFGVFDFERNTFVD